jgi:hypothetical protein
MCFCIQMQIRNKHMYRGRSSISYKPFWLLLRYSPCKFLFLYCNQTQKKGRLKEHFLPFWILCVDVNTRINFMSAMLLGNCVDGMRDGVGAFSKRSGVSRLVFLFHSLQGMCLVGRQAGFIFFTRTNQNLHSNNHLILLHHSP